MTTGRDSTLRPTATAPARAPNHAGSGRLSRQALAGAVALAFSFAACGSADDSHAQASYGCDNPTPAQGGYEACGSGPGDGWLHRPQVMECPSTVPRSGYSCSAPGGIQGCTTDADCAGASHGYCSFQPPGDCLCQQGCTKDADCGAGSICVCSDVVGYCAESSCESDADCADGFLCGSYHEDSTCTSLKFQCQRPDDECVTHSDCPDGWSCVGASGRRVCSDAVCYY